MVSFTTTLVAATAIAGVLARAEDSKRQNREVAKRANTANSQGTSGGFFYQFWDDDTSGSTTYTNGAAGQYSVNWNNVGDFTAGKGWSTATPRNIAFSGTVSASGNFYLAVYTWSTQGENYILENYGSYNPCSQGTVTGSLTSDGSTYQVCTVNRGNNYMQNWSVRANKRSSGTVTTANHYNFYAAHGGYNPLSAAQYQIVSTEGFGSTGSATITVSDAGTTGSTSTAAPTSSSSSAAGTKPSSTSSASGATQTKYGQCGGTGWTGATVCASGSTCKAVSPPYYSQCL